MSMSQISKCHVPVWSPKAIRPLMCMSSPGWAVRRWPQWRSGTWPEVRGNPGSKHPWIYRYWYDMCRSWLNWSHATWHLVMVVSSQLLYEDEVVAEGWHIMTVVSLQLLYEDEVVAEGWHIMTVVSLQLLYEDEVVAEGWHIVTVVSLQLLYEDEVVAEGWHIVTLVSLQLLYEDDVVAEGWRNIMLFCKNSDLSQWSTIYWSGQSTASCEGGIRLQDARNTSASLKQPSQKMEFVPTPSLSDLGSTSSPDLDIRTLVLSMLTHSPSSSMLIFQSVSFFCSSHSNYMDAYRSFRRGIPVPWWILGDSGNCRLQNIHHFVQASMC